jgi:hypothetical protein
MAVTIDGTSGITTPAIPSGGPIAGTTGTFSGALQATTGTFSGAVRASGVASDIYPLVIGTSVTTTGSASFTITGIPSWAKRVTVMFNNVSPGNALANLLQLGTSSGTVSSGYTSSSQASGGSSGSTSGFSIYSNTAASGYYGTMVIYRYSGNTWVQTQNLFLGGTSIVGYGVVTLSADLDRVVLSGVTDPFDAGSFNIMYEG